MSFYSELRRRNVFRVGIAYVVAAWMMLQVFDVIGEILELPVWSGKLILTMLVFGFFISLIGAWAYEMTPEGIKLQSEVDRNHSITTNNGRKLNGLITGLLLLAVAYLLFDKFWFQPRLQPTTANESELIAAQGKLQGGPKIASIAVLPFVNMSADPDNEYFADGVSEEILNVLADVEDLRVSARTSSFAFKGSTLGIDQIADRLGVNLVLEGSVRKSGEHVRITAQLVHAADGFNLWSETYDRQLTNIFAIQDEIANNIARVLALELTGRERLYTRVEDLPLEVYEQFLKARFLTRRRNPADMEEGIRLLREVTDAAPGFPRGYALLAEALAHEQNRAALGRAKDISYFPEIESLVSRALELDPNQALAHLVDAYLAISENNSLEVIRKMERAVELDPEVAVDLDPENANTHAVLGEALLLLGDYSGAEVHFREQLRLGNLDASSRIVEVAVLAGDVERARFHAKELPWERPADAIRIEHFLDAVEDVSKIPDFVAYLLARPDEGPRAHIELMTLNQFEVAIELSSEAINSAWAEIWAKARALPSFKAHVLKARLPEVWDALGPPSACRKKSDGYDCNPPENGTGSIGAFCLPTIRARFLRY